MAGDKQPWNTLGYAEKCLVAAKASLNASALSSEGSSKKLMDCGIDTMKISTLGEYLANKKRTEAAEIDNDKIEGLREDSKLARTFVVPVILPNGQEIEVIVNSKGQDMACMYKDEAGNEKEFKLTPRMKKQIEKGIDNVPEGLEAIVGKEFLDEVKEEIQTEYSPNKEIINVEDFAEKVSKDALVPGKKQFIDKVNEKNGVKSEVEENDIENNKEIPAEARDIISKICSETQNCDISDLKQVIEVRDPNSLTDKLENTGFSPTGGKIYCLRFRGKETGGQDRIIMVQGTRAVDERRYDEDVTELMNDKYSKVVNELKDRDSKIVYTDMDGNTFVADLEREPRDLKMSEKEDLMKELANLDALKEDELASAESEEEIANVFKISNERRKALFEKYGIKVPEIEAEMTADTREAEETIIEATANEEALEEDEFTGYDEDGLPVVPGKRNRFE